MTVQLETIGHNTADLGKQFVRAPHAVQCKVTWMPWTIVSLDLGQPSCFYPKMFKVVIYQTWLICLSWGGSSQEQKDGETQTFPIMTDISDFGMASFIFLARTEKEAVENFMLFEWWLVAGQKCLMKLPFCLLFLLLFKEKELLHNFSMHKLH